MYIPAGDPQKSSYWDQLSELNWQDFFYKGNRYGVPFFIELKERIREELKPDFLLIDSRTGISQILGITASILSDQVIVLGANNKENLDGAALVLKTISKKENHVLDKQLQINFVLTRIPYPENKAEELREKRRIQEVQDTLNEKLGEGIIEEILVIHSDRELEWKEETRITGDRTQPITRDYLQLFRKIEDSLKEEEQKRFERIDRAKELYEQAFKEKDLKKKIEILTETIELNSDDGNAYFWRGYYSDKLKKHDSAIADYTKVIELNPEDAIAYNNRGYVFREQKKHKLALEDLLKSIDLDSKNGHNYKRLSEIHADQNNREDFYKNIEIALYCGCPIEDLDEEVYNQFKNEKRFQDLLKKYEQNKKK